MLPCGSRRAANVHPRRKEGVMRRRLFSRRQGGQLRWYLEARDYADVGGRREALVVPGQKLGTTDRKLAEVLMAGRLKELQALRAKHSGRAVAGLPPETLLGAY